MGREGRHTNGFSDQSSFLKVLPSGPDRDQLELLRIKIKYSFFLYIYPSPMFVWRGIHPSLSSSLTPEFELKITEEKCNSHSMPESFTHKRSPRDLLWVRFMSTGEGMGYALPVNIIGWVVGFVSSYIKYCFCVYRISEEANASQKADLQEMDSQALCFIKLCETTEEWPTQDCSF